MSQPTAHLLALADFNDARLNDDERIAKAATPGPWAVDNETYAEQISSPDGPVVSGGRWGGEASVFESTEDALHIARHDPARVLGEVAAKRVLIANWRELILRIDAEPDPDKRGSLALTRHGLDQVAYQLASVHADHPDYQESWRP